MKQINSNERNLFSKNIIELKLISDRIAEGKGEDAGIFSNTYQILYILSRKESVTPKEIISELNIAKSNLAILAKKLIKDGLLSSHKDKNNKREIFYMITDLGTQMLQEKLDNIDTLCDGDSKKGRKCDNPRCRRTQKVGKQDRFRKKEKNKRRLV